VWGKSAGSGRQAISSCQDDYPTYGNQLNAFEIVELSATEYRESAHALNPILEHSGEPWTRSGMHHLDAHKVSDTLWIGCVDGNDE